MTPPPIRKGLFSPWGLACLGAAVLSLVPVIDLWVGTLFFNAELVTWMPRSALMAFARNVLPEIIIGVLLAVIALWLTGRLMRKAMTMVTGRHVAFLVISLAVGPGLIVESILKTFSGRARPRDITIFSGEHPFTPALWLADSCARNCSFASGHAALAFWTTAFAFICPAPYRAWVFIGGLVLGALMGLARMAEGAHFLSDVFYAGLIVVALNVWLAHRFKLAGERHGA